MPPSNIFDADVDESEIEKLRRRRFKLTSFPKHWKDEYIVKRLQQLKRATFITHDSDYYKRKLVNSAYCLIYFDVPRDELATYVLKVYRHPLFNTKAKRCGKVIKITSTNISYFKVGFQEEKIINWN